MIALLRGRLVATALDEIVVDVAGVGYRVRIPAGQAPGTVGDEVTVHTHLAVREDALTLYGFADPAARDLFTTLLSVSGVGPKVALAALGTLGERGLHRAVAAEDVTGLTRIPGVGRKGAQRMLLELRERLGPGTGGPGPDLAASAGAHTREEVREALASLGYAPAEAARAVERVDAADAADASAEELLRRALRELAGA